MKVHNGIIYFRNAMVQVFPPKVLEKNTHKVIFRTQSHCKPSVIDPAMVFEHHFTFAIMLGRLALFGLYVMWNNGDCSIAQYYAAAPERVVRK